MRCFLALFFYRFLMLLATPVLLVALLLRSLSHSQYRQRLKERLGILPNTLNTDSIVVHAASVGEVIALKPFITQLLVEHPHTTITVTTFTPTGSAQVAKLFGKQVQHCYLPLDNIMSTQLFLQRLQPKMMVFMETELWPNLIAQCQAKKIKLMLINGRLSDKSMRSYQKLRWLITPTIQRFNTILTQSQINQDNYLTMGASPEQCQLSGNLKFDISLNDDVMAKQATLAKMITESRHIWLIASTHAGDEALALQAFSLIKAHDSSALLIIVPRHPERFEQVAKLAEEAGNKVLKRSENISVTCDTNVWVIDTLGELLPAYALADVVTIGGSFSDIGGHNPLEPALFEKPIIVGPNMSNFTEILTQMKFANAIVQLTEPETTAENLAIPSIEMMSERLAAQVVKLLLNNTLATSLGQNACQVVKANQGATKRSLAALRQLI